MGYCRSAFSHFRSDRDDAARARAFDEAYPLLSESEQAWCDRALYNLTQNRFLGPNQAKAMVISLLCFCFMKVDEQDKWRAHGEFVHQQIEWAEVGKVPLEEK